MSDADGWLSVWVETGRDSRNPAVVTGWLPLHVHLADTGAVASLLVDRWVSPRVIARIARDTDRDTADVRDAGIDADSDCEEGYCGTCELVVLDGVPDHRDSVLSTTERASHRTFMPCVSRACTPTLAIDL